jgi:hypothetical protein
MDGAGHLGRRRERTGSCQRLVPTGGRVRTHQVLTFFSPPLCLRLICIITTEF